MHFIGDDRRVLPEGVDRRSVEPTLAVPWRKPGKVINEPVSTTARDVDAEEAAAAAQAAEDDDGHQTRAARGDVTSKAQRAPGDRAAK